jgi:hypothetical protein
LRMCRSRRTRCSRLWARYKNEFPVKSFQFPVGSFDWELETGNWELLGENR